MSIFLNSTAIIGKGGQTVALGSLLTVTGSGNPAYLVLSGLDRKEYTTASNGSTGTLSGKGATLGFSSIGGDGRGAGIAFSYVPTSGLYWNASYGYLDQLTYTMSSSTNALTNFSLYGATSLGVAASYLSNPYVLSQINSLSYLGSITVANQPSFGAAPSQATPYSIAKVAQSFLGQAWNADGCWVLASTICAEAGAGLPIDSTMVGLPARANGQWIVAFDGSKTPTGNWKSILRAGEIIVIGGPGIAHIATVVSGVGATAMLIDNMTVTGPGGKILNSANDGSPRDIIIQAPHLASQEWPGVLTSNVKIYQLDVPIVTATAAATTMASKLTQKTALTLAPWFTATDPAGKAIQQWQVYNSAASDSLTLSGIAKDAHSEENALTTTSLSAICLLTGPQNCTDTINVRAYNGSWWGDWTTLNVTVSGLAQAPLLAKQTASQLFNISQKFSLVLPTGTFTDPNGFDLTYTATLENGQPLPSWLSFNAATRTFTGTIPANTSPVQVKVTATDTAGLTASETFSIGPLTPPKLVAQTPAQTVKIGTAFSISLAGAFTDPDGQSFTETVTQLNGVALPTWLKFNATTLTLSGTAPATQQKLTLVVVAKDTSGLSASESFTLTLSNTVPATSLTKALALPAAISTTFIDATDTAISAATPSADIVAFTTLIGAHTLTSFNPAQDVIQFANGIFADAADLHAHAAQSFGGITLYAAQGSLFLPGFTAGQVASLPILLS